MFQCYYDAMAVTLAVVNLKGGTGKTTTAVALAECAAEQYQETVRVLDLDPQGSASAWAAAAERVGEPLRAEVLPLVEHTAVKLRRSALQAAEGVPLVVLDTPPGDPAVIDVAFDIADLAIICSAATAMDIPRALDALVAAEDMGCPVVVLLTKTRAGTVALEEARTVLLDQGAAVLQVGVPLRQAIAVAANLRPRPNDELMKVYAPVLEAVLDAVDGGTKATDRN